MKTTQKAAALLTIDSESTLDIDDAVSVWRLEGGGFGVLVAIADPTDAVPLGSPVDLEARKRVATQYAATRTISRMLPADVSEGSCSLVEGAERPAFKFEMRLSDQLEVESFEVSRSPIVVKKRLTYQGKDEDMSSDVAESLSTAATLCAGLAVKRRNKGALSLYDLNRLVYATEDGRLVKVKTKGEVVRHLVVNELMVLTNTQLARFLVEKNVPSVFRNHQARDAAPKSDQMLLSLESFIAGGGMESDEEQAGLGAVLGRARYGGRALGHYALAEACYCHGTSPLRRYPDLLVMHQLRAFLEGRSYAFGQDEVEALAEQMSDRLDVIRDERGDAYKDAARRKAEHALESGRVSRLGDSEVAQAVKIAPQDGALPEALELEICRRLANDSATDKLVDTLMAVMSDVQWTERLSSSIADWVKRAPPRSFHVIHHLAQTGSLKDMQITSSGAGTDFTAEVRFSRRGELAAVFNGSASRKKEAEQAACVKAVCWLVGMEDAAVDSVAGAAPVLGNPKGQLMEYAQKRAWQPPVFKSEGVGPPHAMRFHCVATMQGGGRTWTRRVDGASTKKEAEAKASQELLEALGVGNGSGASSAEGASDARAENQGSEKSGGVEVGNPVGQLQEAAQKNRWATPNYTFETLSEVPPLFRATVSIAGPKPGSYSAEASTKQEAKRLSAQKALRG